MGNKPLLFCSAGRAGMTVLLGAGKPNRRRTSEGKVAPTG